MEGLFGVFLVVLEEEEEEVERGKKEGKGDGDDFNRFLFLLLPPSHLIHPLPGAVGCGTAVVPLSLSVVNGRARVEMEGRRGGRRGGCVGGVRAATATAAANFDDDDDAGVAFVAAEGDAVACDKALIAAGKLSRARD